MPVFSIEYSKPAGWIIGAKKLSKIQWTSVTYPVSIWDRHEELRSLLYWWCGGGSVFDANSRIVCVLLERLQFIEGNVWSFLKENRKSLLKDNLHDIDLLCNELVNLIKQCLDRKKSTSMNLSMLSQTYMEKLEVVKEIIAKVGQIKAKVSDHSLVF